MAKKLTAILITILTLCVFLTSCASDQKAVPETVPEFAESYLGMPPVGGVWGAYAELENVTKTGCSLRIAGDPHWEISNIFSVYDISGSGGETLIIPTADYSSVEGFYISESGIVMDYSWEDIYGPLPRGQYRIKFILLEGTGSITFERDFTIH